MNEFQNNTAQTSYSELSPRVPVTPNVMFSMRFPGDVNLSSDGQRVAFVVREWVTDAPKMRKRIWVVETSGGEPRPFTRDSQGDSCPRWSPDSSQLAFISKANGEGSKSKSQLHLISAQGGESRQVCTMPNGISDLAWSPDGSRIAFLSLEGEEPKTDPKVITPGRHQRLWTVWPENDTPEPVTPDGLTIWEYAWSPDSKRFAVYCSVGPDETDWYRGQIGIVAANGGAVQQVTQLTQQAASLVWSPDGTRLAYISGEWSDRGLVGGDLFVLSLASGEVHNLTPGVDCSPSWCRWFPDSRRLLYTDWKGVTHQVGILNEADDSMKTLVKDFVMGESPWPHLSATPDLRAFATTHSDHEHPYDVWFGELTDNATSVSWRQLSRLNPIAEETLKLSPAERIRYESTDGWQIDAIFTPPLPGKSDGLPPLIVDVHGGPSWAWTDGWDFMSQLLASAGYAVLRPNIRGSLGRGVAFADAVIHDMGGKDLQDVLHGVEYLVERGLADSKRVGIMGGSYGGFMTAWAVTQTTRFKAAIMVAGVSDFHSFHAQSNIPDWDMRFLGTTPLEGSKIYREHSAITYAARVTTPTLIIHGENDESVPVNQAYAFYRALRERNVPTELVIYPREGHGMNEREHIRDYMERILQWFGRYL